MRVFGPRSVVPADIFLFPDKELEIYKSDPSLSIQNI
jgi:hypothetical protein